MQNNLHVKKAFGTISNGKQRHCKEKINLVLTS